MKSHRAGTVCVGCGGGVMSGASSQMTISSVSLSRGSVDTAGKNAGGKTHKVSGTAKMGHAHSPCNCTAPINGNS